MIETGPSCEFCGHPIQRITGKRPRRFCDSTCRVRAHRSKSMPQAVPEVGGGAEKPCNDIIQGKTLPLNRYGPRATSSGLSGAVPDPATTQAYSASSIRVLPDKEFCRRFDWAGDDELVRRHPHKPESFIRRLCEACRLSGYPGDLAIRRYLEGDKSVPVTEEMVAVYQALADQKR